VGGLTNRSGCSLEKLQGAITFFRSRLIFPAPQHPKNSKQEINHGRSNPPPRSPDLIPHEVSQDPPFDGNDNHPLPIVPDAIFGDQTTAGAAATITVFGCNDDRLKACIACRDRGGRGGRVRGHAGVLRHVDGERRLEASVPLLVDR
jgi:hypothetical protein